VAHRITYAGDGVLHATEPPGGPETVIGSPAWAARLSDPPPRSFSFRGPSDTFIAPREDRVDAGAYWTAYSKRGDRLRITYPRKSEKPTLKILKDDAEVPDGSDNAQWRADGGEPPLPPAGSSQALKCALGRRRRCRFSGRGRYRRHGRRRRRRRSVPCLPVEDHQPDRHGRPHDASEQVGPRKVGTQGP